MKENKLGTYLTSFTEQDWSAYNKFSKTLYPKDSDYQLVINYIKRNKRRYDPSFMDSEYLRKKIRPSASKQVFFNVTSGLCKHIENYFTWAEVENDPMMKDTLLLQALGKRGLTNQFHKHKLNSKEKRDNLPKGLWNNYHAFMAEYLLYYCNMTSDIKISKVALENAFGFLKKFSGTINHYLVLEMQNRSLLLNENWNNQTSFYEKNIKSKHDLSDILDELIKMKVFKNKNSFQYLLSKIKNTKISNQIRYTTIIHLLSFISHKDINGDSSYRTKMIELQKYGLKNDILFPSGKIPAPRFINIINRACEMKEYKWANELLNNYSNCVPNTSSSNTKTLGLAQIESSKGNFENVLHLLSNTKYKIYEQEMRAKWLILCANYELNKDNFEIINYSINNFNYFIKRNKKNTTNLTSTSLLNTSKYLFKIAKGYRLNEIKLNKENKLFFRNWLKKKIDEKIAQQNKSIEL